MIKYDSFKHNRRSIRLEDYDYSSEGFYFVTMCSIGRECLFANLDVGAGLAPAQSDVSDLTQNDVTPPDPLNYKLTRIGEILDKQWNEIPVHYRNVILDEYVIMPNHCHGILVIGNDQYVTHDLDEDVTTISGNVDSIRIGPSSGRAPARGAPTATLGSIIGAFKSRCVNENLKYIEENGLNELGKFWQRNYYERIIRNNSELIKIRQYISNNHLNWMEDEEYPDN